MAKEKSKANETRMLRDGFTFTPVKLNICSNWGGLGDHIARLPAIRYVLDSYQYVSLNLYWHDYAIPLVKLLLPESDRLKHYKISEFDQADESLPLIDFRPYAINSCRISLVQYAFLTIANRLPPTEESQYYLKYAGGISLAHDLTNHVIVAPCFTSETRQFRGSELNDLVRGIQQEFGLKVALLGKTEPNQVGNGNKVRGNIPEGFDRSLADLDLIDQLTLPECLEAASQAKALVGIDNGLLHLSACTDTPSVWGFTSVSADIRIPKGIKADIVLPEVSCHGCQNRTAYLRHDFRTCLFGDFKCTYEMTATKFLSKIRNILA